MKKIYLILLIILGLVTVLTTTSSRAQSSTSNLSGWAWSSNVGWVDFSKVTFSTTTTTGTLGGYAWSSNIGWISFNPAINSDCPLQPEDGGDCTPRVNLSTGKAQGWVRALAGCQNDIWSGSACTASSSGNANGINVSTVGEITPASGGEVMLAAEYGGYLYLSRDSGVTWTQIKSPGTAVWLGTAMSADGSKMVAVKGSGYIYTSIDGGVTWVARTSAGSRSWSDVAMSSDGKRIVASADGGYIYTSIDGGVTWVARTSAGSRSWNDIVASDDGQKILASVSNSIYISRDGGVTWVQSASSVGIPWTDIETSSDGSSYYVGMSSLSGGKSAVYTSSDGGVTWIKRIESTLNSPKWDGLSVSPNGEQIVAGLSDSSQACVKISRDYGATWTTGHCESGAYIFDTATSRDKNKIISTFKNGEYLYISNDAGVTWSPIVSAGQRNWNKVEMNRGFAGQSQTTEQEKNGWDGWIHLSGTNHTSPNLAGTGGVTFASSTGKFNGYAWGSDVIGWLSFDAGTNSVVCPTCGSGPSTPLAASCLGSQSSNTSATWSATISGGNTPYTYTWNGSAHTPTYTKSDPAISNGDTLRGPSLSISSADGQTVTPICPDVVISVTNNSGARMWVNNNPALTTTKVRTGRNAKLNWSIVTDFINNGYDTCTGQGGSLAGWTGSTITTDKPNYTPYLLPMPTPGSYTLKIKCSMSADPSQFQETNTVNVIVSDSVIEEI